MKQTATLVARERLKSKAPFAEQKKTKRRSTWKVLLFLSAKCKMVSFGMFRVAFFFFCKICFQTASLAVKSPKNTAPGQALNVAGSWLLRRGSTEIAEKVIRKVIGAGSLQKKSMMGMDEGLE